MTESTTVYVQLLDEGSTAYRPTQAVPVGDDVYILLPTHDYDPEDEVWEFLPGEHVRCEKAIKQGRELLIARSSVAPSAA